MVLLPVEKGELCSNLESGVGGGPGGIICELGRTNVNEGGVVFLLCDSCIMDAEDPDCGVLGRGCGEDERGGKNKDKS
jgi:hypothetical protein